MGKWIERAMRGICRLSTLRQPQRAPSYFAVVEDWGRRKRNRVFERGADLAEEADGPIKASQAA